MYACLQHEGKINQVDLPDQKKPGRPRKNARVSAPGAGPPDSPLVPGPLVQRAADPGACAPAPAAIHQPESDAEAVRALLLDAGLGHHHPAFARQKATLAALTELTYSDLHVIFGLTLTESHALKTALARSQADARPSSPGLPCNRSCNCPATFIACPVSLRSIACKRRDRRKTCSAYVQFFVNASFY